VAALPAREREAIVAAVVGRAGAEAAAPGGSANAVYQALHRARRRLREAHQAAWAGFLPWPVRLGAWSLATPAAAPLEDVAVTGRLGKALVVVVASAAGLVGTLQGGLPGTQAGLPPSSIRAPAGLVAPGAPTAPAPRPVGAGATLTDSQTGEVQQNDQNDGAVGQGGQGTAAGAGATQDDRNTGESQQNGQSGGADGQAGQTSGPAQHGHHDDGQQGGQTGEPAGQAPRTGARA
jgi:hypothetical protein